MTREYYVVEEVPSISPYERDWELRKYNERKQLLTVGTVTQLRDNNFKSDDIAFQRHGNQKASRRVRVVKEHIKQGEPKAACYWIEKGKVHCFKI